jgi:trans-aconitate 2-methyltransferase
LKKSWNARLYQERYRYVWKAAENLIDLLAPHPKERILDLGCGPGHLTAMIAARGAAVTGMDASREMIRQARKNYPQIHFQKDDARTFRTKSPYDAIFSNAALHWIKEADQVVRSVARALKVGGRFVAEFGGKGNVLHVHRACETALERLGVSFPRAFFPWYFPSQGEYARLLERQGLAMTYGVLFDRPTELEGGETALRDWLEMFGGAFLNQVPDGKRETFLQLVEELARPDLYREGRWVMDYRRLRLVAQKQR